MFFEFDRELAVKYVEGMRKGDFLPFAIGKPVITGLSTDRKKLHVIVMEADKKTGSFKRYDLPVSRLRNDLESIINVYNDAYRKEVAQHTPNMTAQDLEYMRSLLEVRTCLQTSITAFIKAVGLSENEAHKYFALETYQGGQFKEQFRQEKEYFNTPAASIPDALESLRKASPQNGGRLMQDFEKNNLKDTTRAITTLSLCKIEKNIQYRN